MGICKSRKSSLDIEEECMISGEILIKLTATIDAFHNNNYHTTSNTIEDSQVRGVYNYIVGGKKGKKPRFSNQLQESINAECKRLVDAHRTCCGKISQTSESEAAWTEKSLAVDSRNEMVEDLMGEVKQKLKSEQIVESEDTIRKYLYRFVNEENKETVKSIISSYNQNIHKKVRITSFIESLIDPSYQTLVSTNGFSIKEKDTKTRMRRFKFYHFTDLEGNLIVTDMQKI